MAQRRNKAQPSQRISIGKEQILEVLTAWRKEKAEAMEIPEYLILWNESLHDIACKGPVTIDELAGINRISGSFIAKYGDTVIQMISRTKSDNEKGEKKRPSSYAQQVDMYKSGMSIEEIARERGIQPGTVLSNLYRGVKHGLLDITELVSPELYERAENFVNSHPRITNVTQMRQAMGCICDYGLIGYLMQKRDARCAKDEETITLFPEQ